MGTPALASFLGIPALILAATSAAVAVDPPRSAAGSGHLVWRIGVADGRSAEFALGPAGYAKYQNDGFFVVGRSEP